MVDDLDVVTTNTLLENNLMPNLQKEIIDKGTKFTNSFVTNSDCCPSRATFLTGQYSHNHGVLKNNPPENILKFEDDSSLPVWLKQVGYRTGFVGKYLNGYGVNTQPSYIPPGWTEWHALIDPATYKMYGYTMNHNGDMMNYGSEEQDYQTDVLTNISKKFIDESDFIDDEKPFFLAILPVAPHRESYTLTCSLNYLDFSLIRPPERYKNVSEKISFPKSPSFNEKDVSDKPPFVKELSLIDTRNQACLDEIFQGRIESMLAVDDLIEEVISSLKMNNELGNTVIIFTSDNGFLLGQHRLFAKWLVYEESIRVPLFIRAPQYTVKQSHMLVTNNDLAPTIVEFAKATPDLEMDGQSLIRLLENPEYYDWRTKFLVEHFEGIGKTHFGIRTDSKVLIEYENFTEFYDLKEDPYQMNSIHDCKEDSCVKELEKLKLWLQTLKTCKLGACKIFEKG